MNCYLFDLHAVVAKWLTDGTLSYYKDHIGINYLDTGEDGNNIIWKQLRTVVQVSLQNSLFASDSLLILSASVILKKSATNA